MYSQTVNFSDTTWEKLGDVRDSALVTPAQYESGPTGRTMTRIAALGGASARPATVHRRGAFDRARAPGATGLGRPSWLARENQNLNRAPNRGNTGRVVVRGPRPPKSTAVDQLSGTPAPPPVTDRPPGPQRVKLHRLSKTADLPNGMTVHYISPPDVQFLYGEIFEEHCYVRNGITLHTDDVVIDVGGNIGLFAMYAAKKCVCGKVFTLEPIPSTYRAMVRNLCENLSPNPTARANPRLSSRAPPRPSPSATAGTTPWTTRISATFSVASYLPETIRMPTRGGTRMRPGSIKTAASACSWRTTSTGSNPTAG